MSVLSMAEIANPSLEFSIGKEKVEISDALEILKHLVWRVYSRMENIYSWESDYDLFVKSLQAFASDKNNSFDIITTNYDLLPEMIRYAIGRKATMPVQFSKLPLPAGYNAPPNCASLSGMGGYGIYENSSSKNLHKLHGSVNWFVNKSPDITDLFCWDETFPSFLNNDGLFLTPFCVSVDAQIPTEYSPVIIPPTMIKEYKIPVISKTWQDASNAIEKADRVIFIGYSFPPTDTIMKFFLGTSLANNLKGCRVSIIDKHATQVMHSLKEIFVDDICNHYIDTIEVEFKNIFTLPRFQSLDNFVQYLKS
jgi:hypothetical protein